MLRFQFGSKSATVIGDEPKEPDFEFVCGRDDFKKLLAELEMRNKAKAAKISRGASSAGFSITACRKASSIIPF